MDVPNGPKGYFFGLGEDLQIEHINDTAPLTPKPDFAQHIKTYLSPRHWKPGSMAHGDARSLRGRLLHISNIMSGRVARRQTYAFEHLLQSDSPTLPPNLHRCSQFYLQLIDLAPSVGLCRVYGRSGDWGRQAAECYTVVCCSISKV